MCGFEDFFQIDALMRLLTSTCLEDHLPRFGLSVVLIMNSPVKLNLHKFFSFFMQYLIGQPEVCFAFHKYAYSICIPRRVS